jgi:hypothetical protein
LRHFAGALYVLSQSVPFSYERHLQLLALPSQRTSRLLQCFEILASWLGFLNTLATPPNILRHFAGAICALIYNAKSLV